MTDLPPYRIEHSIYGDFGGVKYPLSPDNFESTFVSLDPARSRLSALFATAIRYELAPIWSKVIASGKPHPLSNSTSAVAMVMELDPVTHLMKQVKTDYPLLCLHRVGEQTWSPHTLQGDKCEQDWNLHYILPNLDIGETRKFYDVLRIIPDIVARVIRSRGHIAYDNGALQFFGDKGGIGSIGMTRAESGQARFGGQVESPVWLATTITLHTIEYSKDSEEQYGAFEGIDWSIGVGDSTGTIPNVIEAYSDVDFEVELLNE